MPIQGGPKVRKNGICFRLYILDGRLGMIFLPEAETNRKISIRIRSDSIHSIFDSIRFDLLFEIPNSIRFDSTDSAISSIRFDSIRFDSYM